MAFPLRKNRPGRYWKGRMNFATALAETTEKDSEEPQPTAVAVAEPVAGDELRSIADRVLGLGRTLGDSPAPPAAPASVDESPASEPAAADGEPAYPAAFEELVAYRPAADAEAGPVAHLADTRAVGRRLPLESEGPDAEAPVAIAAPVAPEEPAQPADERTVAEANRPLPTIEAPVPRPRAVGAPLPRGKASPPSVFELRVPARRSLPSPPPAPAIHKEAEEEHSTGGQRAGKVFRAAVPLLQRLLPLLDGNVVGAVTNLLAPPHKPSAPLDLGPVHDALTELQVRHRELRDQVAEQNITIGRVEDQLERVREATDRNTLEQQELMDDLRAVGFKANVIALAALAMLLIALFLDLFLYLRFQRVFP